MRYETSLRNWWSFFTVLLLLVPSVQAQITTFQDSTAPVGTSSDRIAIDKLLHAPYTGPADTLRDASAQMPYGEVRPFVFPRTGSAGISNPTVHIWADRWDRSQLRMFRELDASGTELDLTNTSSANPVVVEVPLQDFDSQTQTPAGVARFSLKALSTRTLAEESFRITVRYTVTGPSSVTQTTVVRTAPTTGSFAELPRDEAAYCFGAKLLDVRVGAARLVVPAGRTAQMIGETFEVKDDSLGPSRTPAVSAMRIADVLLPGAAESVYLPAEAQFRLPANPATNNPGGRKTQPGTPWSGQLLGYFNGNNGSSTEGPDGTRYVPESIPATDDFGTVRRHLTIRPRNVPANDPATQVYRYEVVGGVSRVTMISDQATPPNTITLVRGINGAVTTVGTSDGRSWTIESDSSTGWITAIIPSDQIGARYYTRDPSNNRIRTVSLMPGGQPIYEFVYSSNDLSEERRQIDGVLRTVVRYDRTSDTLWKRFDYVNDNDFRRTDFEYDPTLKSRLVAIHRYGMLNDTAGTGPRFTTRFTHDVGNPVGNMVITSVTLPDGGRLDYQYDSSRTDTSTFPSTSTPFGRVSKVTRVGVSGESLVLLDVDYDHIFTPASGSAFDRQLLFSPRVVQIRDGRGSVSQVEYVYEAPGIDSNGDLLAGERSNDLLQILGPSISLGPSGPRQPRTVLTYNTRRLLDTVDETFAESATRRIRYEYDPLRRINKVRVDPNGLNLVTEVQYSDTTPEQRLTVIDPDMYHVVTEFGPDGRRVRTSQQLNAGQTNGVRFDTIYSYDPFGRMSRVSRENKDKFGTPLSPATIDDSLTFDPLGRLELLVRDLGGVASRIDYTYNWQNEVIKEQDTSLRGVEYGLDGRGLVISSTPLDNAGMPTLTLRTTFDYSPNGVLVKSTRPSGAATERVLDPFDRDLEIRRLPAPGSGTPISSRFEYDAASNPKRVTVAEGSTTLWDVARLYDEGGFNYESRRRLQVGMNGESDPILQRKFDWSGRVIESRNLGDAASAPAFTSAEYDLAGRIRTIRDATGGRTDLVRDGRGNVITQFTLLADPDIFASTDFTFDALSRPVRVTLPSNALGTRAVVSRDFDSRGNLTRESVSEMLGAEPTFATAYTYDGLNRPLMQAVLNDAASAGTTIDRTRDRVTDTVFDADGRVQRVVGFNNGSAAEIPTIFDYDSLGRLHEVLRPSGARERRWYDTAGRMERIEILEGTLTPREILLAYDAHDRLRSEAQRGTGGDADLISSVIYDGLDRVVLSTNPRGISAETRFDLAGRLSLTTDDVGGADERSTTFVHDRLDRPIKRTSDNRVGGQVLPQDTSFRWDPLGRLTRVVFPDAGDDQHANPAQCSDCVRISYDLAGRPISRTDQRGLLTISGFDARNRLIQRTTAGPGVGYSEVFTYDALDRVLNSARSSSSSVPSLNYTHTASRDYTDLGNQSFDQQQLNVLPRTTVSYTHDQAGNPTSITYPSGPSLVITPTADDQAASIKLNGSPLMNYFYDGGIPVRRDVILPVSGGSNQHRATLYYDTQRRVRRVKNTFLPHASGQTTLADFSYVLDPNGSPSAQSFAGPLAPSGPRSYSVDRLDRLTGVTFGPVQSNPESLLLDSVGNRLESSDRSGQRLLFLANAANEYTIINGRTLQHDAAGNLTLDADGRSYSYDEFNRLTRVVSAQGIELASFGYDAFGRRASSTIGDQTTIHRFSGDNEIEDVDLNGIVRRWHVHGHLGVDERALTFNGSGASPPPTYHLLDRLFSVPAQADAAGNLIRRLDYSATGSFAGRQKHDADADGDVDLDDYTNLQRCANSTSPDCLSVHDADASGVADGVINGSDFQGFAACMRGPGLPPGCSPSGAPGVGQPIAPLHGDFAMHGRPVDVLPDGLVLMHWRARTYSPTLGRFLQRDPSGYVDGPSLYEAFKGNPLLFIDPAGTDAWWAGDVHRWAARQVGDNPLGWRLVQQAEYIDDITDGVAEATSRAFGNPYRQDARWVMAMQNAAQPRANAALRDGRVAESLAVMANTNTMINEVLGWEQIQTDMGLQAVSMAFSAVPVGSIASAAAGPIGKTTVGTSINAFGSSVASTSQRVAQAAVVRVAVEVGASNLPRVTAGAGAARAAFRVVSPAVMTPPVFTPAATGTALASATNVVGSVVDDATASAVAVKSSAPMTGYTWNHVLQARYGADNVEWAFPRIANEPMTLGVLKTPAGDFDLASGWNGYGGLMPKGAPGFDIVTRTHVEGQAAALMQRQGIVEGLLYINNPAICPSCTRNLPYMLGPGRTLEVVPFNGRGVPFTGR